MLLIENRLTRNASGPQPIADRQGDVVGAADLQNVVPVLVCEVLRVVEQAQLQATAAISGILALLALTWVFATQHHAAVFAVQQSDLRMDGAAPRDDACDAVGCQVDVAQQHPGMDREVVHALQL